MTGTTLQADRRFGIRESDWDRICACFRKNDRVKRLVLFGSRARGTFKPASDIDLLVEGDDLTLSDQFQIESTLDDLLLPYTIDVVVKHRVKEPALLEQVSRTGIVLFERG